VGASSEYAIDGQIRAFIQREDGQIRAFIQRDYINPKRNLSSILEYEYEYGNNNNNTNNNNVLSIVVNSTDDTMIINRILQNPYVNRVERDLILTTQIYSESLRYVNLNNDMNCNSEDELNYINRISTLRKRTTETEEEEEKEEKEKENVTRRRLKLFGNDKGERIPYGIEMVQGTELWSLNQTNRSSIEVCVVDTGYNAGHEDLPTVLARQVGGTNTGAGVWFNDGHGHGTHCSGIIGAVGNNDIGVVGIREKPTLNVFHASKGLADDGSGFSSNIMSAVQGCVDNGAKVISLSLGGYENSPIENAFYDDIYNQGIL
jgi:subtilisin family serine protease